MNNKWWEDQVVIRAAALSLTVLITMIAGIDSESLHSLKALVDMISTVVA